jgi:hypothetical protein
LPDSFKCVAFWKLSLSLHFCPNLRVFSPKMEYIRERDLGVSEGLNIDQLRKNINMARKKERFSRTPAWKQVSDFYDIKFFCIFV